MTGVVYDLTNIFTVKNIYIQKHSEAENSCVMSHPEAALTENFLSLTEFFLAVTEKSEGCPSL